LYKIHGSDGLAKKLSKYSAAFKLKVLRRMWEDKLSYSETAVIFNIRNPWCLAGWDRLYREGGIEALKPRQKGRPKAVVDPKDKLPPKAANDRQSREELLAELGQLRMENAYLKKLNALVQARQAPKKAQVVLELRRQYPVEGLLKMAGLARSTFYHQQQRLQIADKHVELKSKIVETFPRHKGRYGYRRITEVLRQSGICVNHKTVQRLMGLPQIKSLVRPKKYRSYKGQVGLVAPNILKRQFEAPRPIRNG
jgi:putative transposase